MPSLAIPEWTCPVESSGSASEHQSLARRSGRIAPTGLRSAVWSLRTIRIRLKRSQNLAAAASLSASSRPTWHRSRSARTRTSLPSGTTDGSVSSRRSARALRFVAGAPMPSALAMPWLVSPGRTHFAALTLRQLYPARRSQAMSTASASLSFVRCDRRVLHQPPVQVVDIRRVKPKSTHRLILAPPTREFAAQSVHCCLDRSATVWMRREAPAREERAPCQVARRSPLRLGMRHPLTSFGEQMAQIWRASIAHRETRDVIP